MQRRLQGRRPRRRQGEETDEEGDGRGHKHQGDRSGHGSFLVAGPLNRPDPVTLVLDHQLGEIMAAIDRNMRELAKLG